MLKNLLPIVISLSFMYESLPAQPDNALWRGHLAFSEGRYDDAIAEYQAYIDGGEDWEWYPEMIETVRKRKELGEIFPADTQRILAVFMTTLVEHTDSGDIISVDITSEKKTEWVIAFGVLQKTIEAWSNGNFTLDFDTISSAYHVERHEGLKPNPARYDELEYFNLMQMKYYDNVATLSKAISPGVGLAATRPYVYYEVFSPPRGMFAVNGFTHGFPTLIHEFFHTIEWISGVAHGVTHGFEDEYRDSFPGWTGETEYDYYRWHFETTLPGVGWKNLRHTTRWIPFQTDTLAWEELHEVYENIPIVDRLVADTLFYDANYLINNEYYDSGFVLLEQVLALSPMHTEALEVLYDYFRFTEPDELKIKDTRDKLKLIRRVSDFSTIEGNCDTLGTVVAFWHREDVPKAWDFVEWDVSKFITGTGIYEFSFFYTNGWKAIDIDSVSLLQNGIRISEDNHTGFSGNVKTDITYKLTVPARVPDASYTLRARIKGNGGVISYGQIHMNKVSECTANTYIQSVELCEGDSLMVGSNIYLNPGTYTDTLPAVSGCDSIIITHITVNPVPLSFDITGQTSPVEYDTFLYSVPEDSEIIYYLWSVENGEVLSYPSAYSAEILWNNSGPGQITVIPVNIYLCAGDTASLVVSIVTGGINNLPVTSLLIYPNPSKDHFFIDTGDRALPAGCIIQIINQIGQVIYESEINRSRYEVKLPAGFRTGIHVVRLTDKDRKIIASGKIIFE